MSEVVSQQVISGDIMHSVCLMFLSASKPSSYLITDNFVSQQTQPDEFTLSVLLSSGEAASKSCQNPPLSTIFHIYNYLSQQASLCGRYPVAVSRAFVKDTPVHLTCTNRARYLAKCISSLHSA